MYSFRLAYSCHALNHALKTRTKVIKHNKTLAATVERIKEIKRKTRDQEKRQVLLQERIIYFELWPECFYAYFRLGLSCRFRKEF